MGKIICEICGTVYPDTADACPICGYSRNGGGFDHGDLLNQDPEQSQDAYDGADVNLDEFADDDFDLSQFDEILKEDPPYEEPPRQSPRRPAARNTPPAAPAGQKPIFDYDAVNPQEAGSYDSYEDLGNEVTLDDYPEEDYDQYYDGPRKSHTGLIVFLIVLILVLIGATAFLFVKFIMPNLGRELPPVPETVMTEPETTAEPTTEPTVPCTSLVLVDGGAVDLSKEGQFFLIHASAGPEDTTDVLTYQSEDESIVTVDENGKITAVGEGQTNILLTCGTQSITLPVTVAYREETVPTEETEAPAIAEAEEETRASAETGETGEAEESTGEAAEETTEDDGLKDVELKLKKSDLMSGVRGVSFRLELDCELDPTEVEWSSTDSGVATVLNGVVTTVGHGTCKIVAKYGDQEVSCVIRCTF